MQTLPGAVISRGWLKKLPLVLQLSNGWGNLFLQQHCILSKAVIQPLSTIECCLGKLGRKTSGQTSKPPKSCSSSSNFNFLSYDADASQLFQNLNWKNFSTQSHIQEALMVFKSLNGLAPEYRSSKFIARSNTTSPDCANKLNIPQPRTNYLLNSFRYSGAVL